MTSFSFDLTDLTCSIDGTEAQYPVVTSDRPLGEEGQVVDTYRMPCGHGVEQVVKGGRLVPRTVVEGVVERLMGSETVGGLES